MSSLHVLRFLIYGTIDGAGFLEKPSEESFAVTHFTSCAPWACVNTSCSSWISLSMSSVHLSIFIMTTYLITTHTAFTVLLISLLLETVVRSTASLRFVWCAQHKEYLFLTYVAKMARQAVDRSAVLIWTRLDDTIIHAMSNMYVNFVYIKYENQVRSREMAIIYLSDFCVFCFLYTRFFLPFI